MIFPARLKLVWEIIDGIMDPDINLTVPAIIPRVKALIRTMHSNFLGALENGAICIILNRIAGITIAIHVIVVASKYPSRTPRNIISSAIGDKISPIIT